MGKQNSLIFLLINLPAIAFPQYTEQQITNFSSRLINPVTVEVKNSGKDITFMAENTSWYPYQVEIHFTNFVNLTPMMNDYKTVINHGRTILFKLTIVDAASYHDYSYNLRYMIGYANKKAMVNYPYPMPLGEGKEIKFYQIVTAVETTFFGNIFMLSPGDTIFCMRKGLVTYIRSADDKSDRLFQSSNVEVIHEDGTVATYAVPDADNILVVPGQHVYPLQPLMISKKPGTLTLKLFEITNMVTRSIDFILEPGEAEEGSPGRKIVKHFPGDTERELTTKEKKKLFKGDLY